MTSIKVVTDSTCDIPADLEEKWDIQVVPSYINFGARSYLDKVEMSREQFYHELVTNSIHPTSATPPPGLFAEIYQKLAQTASGIISLHPPDQLSALRQSALNGWGLVKSAIPFRALDAGQVSMGLGWIAIKVAQAARDGADMNALEKLVSSLRQRVHLFAALDSVTYLRRGGRVGWAQGTIGKLLRVRPHVHVYEGVVKSVGYTRTFGNSLQKLLAELQKLGDLEQLTLLHTNAPELAESLLDRLDGLNRPDSIRQINATPILGTHVGPGAVGFVAVQR